MQQAALTTVQLVYGHWIFLKHLRITMGYGYDMQKSTGEITYEKHTDTYKSSGGG